MCICTTGCSLTDLASIDVVRQWADRGSVNTMTIPSGVVCQSRTTTESQAIYICDNEDGATRRVCQNYWRWNGSIPQCSPNPGGQNGKCIFACMYITAQEPVLRHSYCSRSSRILEFSILQIKTYILWWYEENKRKTSNQWQSNAWHWVEKLCVEWGSTNTTGALMFKISHIECEVKT